MAGRASMLSFAAALAIVACTEAAASAPPLAGAAPGPARQRARACPPDMVELAGLSICIDRYEAAVIRDGRGGTLATSGHARRPASGISYDDADRACAAAGKRLCTEGEWTRACEGPRGLRFPYGSTFDPDRCTTTDPDSGRQPRRPARAGSRPGCVSAEGVYDLSGNVWEWTNASDTSGDLREIRGGGFGNGEGDVRCRRDPTIQQPATAAYDGYGFRCCLGL